MHRNFGAVTGVSVTSFAPKRDALMLYTVGMMNGAAPEHVSVEAGDALLAALKVKMDHPAAMITYVRKHNARGDARHPPADGE